MCCGADILKTDDGAKSGRNNLIHSAPAPWPLRALPVTRGGTTKPTTVRLTDFGGKADGVTDNLPAFKKAFAALARASGGTLVVPRELDRAGESIYLTLPLEITVSNITLILEAGTRVKAKTDTVLSHDGDWPTVSPWENGIDGTALQYAPFIHAINVSDLVITGSGTIDSDGFFWYKSNWCGIGRCAGKLPHVRPRLAVIEGCERVELSNFTTNVSAGHFCIGILHHVQCGKLVHTGIICRSR